jgi:hypothetical protein
MRIGSFPDYRMMRQAGFRMILFGVESANQGTLDRINKGVDADDIIPEIKAASRAGLDPHVAIMCGYGWESQEEEDRTIDLVHLLLRKGYAKTAQASLYDVPGDPAINRGSVRRIYDVARYPSFWYHQIRAIRDIEGLKYFIKAIKKGINDG